MIKQVIIVRTDLNMRKGKMCSQVAHASMKVFFDRMRETTNFQEFLGARIYVDYQINRTFTADFTEQMIEWMNSSFTKIVVGCNSEQELFDLKEQADEANIINAIIQDKGNTEFKEECTLCGGMGEYMVANYDHWEKRSCDPCKGTGKINKPTYTCLAIGPDEAEKIGKITGELKLL